MQVVKVECYQSLANLERVSISDIFDNATSAKIVISVDSDISSKREVFICRSLFAVSVAKTEIINVFKVRLNN